MLRSSGRTRPESASSSVLATFITRYSSGRTRSEASTSTGRPPAPTEPAAAPCTTVGLSVSVDGPNVVCGARAFHGGSTWAPPTVEVPVSSAGALTFPSGRVVDFEIEPERCEALLRGLDDIGMTLTLCDEIEQFEADIERVIMPGLTHWSSPNFMAYFPAFPSFPSLLGEMLCSATNTIGFSWVGSPASTELETRCLDWVANLINLPADFTHQQGKGGGGCLQGTAAEAGAE